MGRPQQPPQLSIPIEISTLGSPGPAIAGLPFCHRVQMRLVKYFKGEADADGAGHFDADNVCSIALLKNGPTRSHVDMQMVAGKSLSAWVDNAALDKIIDGPERGEQAN